MARLVAFMALLRLGAPFDFRLRGAAILDFQGDQSQMPVLKNIFSVRNTQAIFHRFHRPLHRSDDALLRTVIESNFSILTAGRLDEESLDGFFRAFSCSGRNADTGGEFNDYLKARGIGEAACGI